MPKLSPIPGKEVISALENEGFVIKRQSGSHVILQHMDGRFTVVPVHGSKDVPVGTLRAILRDIDISVQDFLESRNK